MNCADCGTTGKEGILRLQPDGAIKCASCANPLPQAPPVPAGADEKKCPACAEVIKADAKKCRHCGEWLNNGAGAKKTAPSQPEYKECVNCQRLIDKSASTCKFCKKSANTRKSSGNPLGVMLFLIGIGVGIFFHLKDTTLPVPGGELIGVERVHNIGLMQERQNGLIAGGVIALLGLILALRR